MKDFGSPALFVGVWARLKGDTPLSS
jgi:hypothetical protein